MRRIWSRALEELPDAIGFRLFGYICDDNSTQSTIDLQQSALLREGVRNPDVAVDTLSPGDQSRPKLEAYLQSLSRQDCLVAYDLRTLASNLDELSRLLSIVADRNLNLKTLVGASAKLNLLSDDCSDVGLLASLIRMQGDIISSRTVASLKRAKAIGRVGGRPKKWTEEELRQAVDKMRHSRMTIQDICTSLGVNRSTLFRRLGTKRDFF